VMSIEVPWDVQHMDLGSYKTLRDAYADLRQPFQTFMHALTDLHRLEGMDEPHLREKVRSIALEFDSRVQLFRNTRFAKKIPKWLPVGIGGFATLAGTAIKSPSVSIPCAVIRVTISVLQELRSSFKPSAIGERESLEMMANLQDAMLVNPTIFRLAGR
jgi:hypothetical protein